MSSLHESAWIARDERKQRRGKPELTLSKQVSMAKAVCLRRSLRWRQIRYGMISTQPRAGAPCRLPPCLHPLSRVEVLSRARGRALISSSLTIERQPMAVRPCLKSSTRVYRVPSKDLEIAWTEPQVALPSGKGMPGRRPTPHGGLQARCPRKSTWLYSSRKLSLGRYLLAFPT